MAKPDIDVEWMLKIVREAGDLALSWFGRTEGTLKSDLSWVTEADLAVEKQLKAAIAEVRPDDAVVGEEASAEGGTQPPPSDGYVWAIDPVDGTRAFNLGLPVWGVSVGILYDGTPTLGAFYLPVVGDMYHAHGVRSYRNGVPLSIPELDVEENSLLLASERTSRSLNLDFPGRVLSLGSCAAHLCYVANGSAVGAIDEACLWDYAAAAAILRPLGIPIRYASGRDMDYVELLDGRKGPESSVVCHPRHFELVQRAYTKPRK